MKPIEKVLIANRGEIAVRIARTCRSMGIATVAVFSDADADALHVRTADEAVRIGAAPSRESYLHLERVIEAARRTGAHALHPGFGFLSERAELSEACAAAGIVFIGPSARVIRAMGGKREAKALAREAGVPVVPGYEGEDQSDAALKAAAEQVGFPVLLKASAGGGGKGMRVCREAGEMEALIASARREAQAAFGDGTLLIEKYVEHPRHVEIQILGDSTGEVVHLFERECSIQRRYQKIIEESPSTALDAALRERMGASAVALGRSIGYEGAGTVEFIVDPQGAYYFLEVNTRLQVEHPVTECLTGLDLVREQIRIARGEPLGYSQEALSASGAALECRLYAEDPEKGFLPASGTLVEFTLPELPGLRVDSGVETGSEVSVHYDPMLAKVITHGVDREEARLRMLRALEQLSVQGVATNRALLLRTLRHPEYRAGHLHTHFLEEHAESLFGEENDETLRYEAALAVAAFDLQRRVSPAPGVRAGFRNNPWRDARRTFRCGDDELVLSYRVQRDGSIDASLGDWRMRARVFAFEGAELGMELEGLRRTYRVVRAGEHAFVQVAGCAFTFVDPPRFPDASDELPQGACVAPMPGKVLKVDVETDQQVAAGQRLLVLEAMKMEHAIHAPSEGRVEQVLVVEGQQVDAEALLVVLVEA